MSFVVVDCHTTGGASRSRRTGYPRRSRSIRAIADSSMPIVRWHKRTWSSYRGEAV